MNATSNAEYVDLNYYNSFGITYDDQMRPYSASSNSCSSSNSDGDNSQLTYHHTMQAPQHNGHDHTRNQHVMGEMHADNAEANVLINSGWELNGAPGINDSYQCTSVIVDSNNFHMTNEYVH